MATYEELMAKSRELAASGDMDSARRVAQIAVNQRGAETSASPDVQAFTAEQPAPQEELPWGYIGEPGNYRPDVSGGGAGQAFVRGAQRGMTLETGDELAAAGTSMASGRSYGTELDAERERGRQNREEHPWAYYGGYIPGAVASTVMGWNAAGVSPVGRSALGTLGRGMGMGAAEGAAVGAAEGEGARDRIVRGLMLGGFGAFTGGMSVPVAWAGQKIGRGVADLATGAFEGLTGKGNPAKANRAIASTLARSGRNVDDVAGDVARAAAEGQPEYRMVDALGKAGSRRASGVVRAGGDGAEELAQFLDQRGIDAADRMLNFTDDAFPQSRVSEVAQRWTGQAPTSTPRTAAQAGDALRGARSTVADTSYSAARGNAGPVDVRGAVAAIDDRIGGMQGVDISGDGIDAKLTRFRSRLISGDPGGDRLGSTGLAASGTDAAPTSVELSDFNRVLGVKQDVQDAIGAATRAGRDNEARELGKLLRELDSALESSSPSYRAANDQFAAQSRVVDAIGEGSDMARRGRPVDTTMRFGNMTPDEQIAARSGYGDTVAGELERTRAAAPDVARAFASTKRTAEAQAMAENPNLFLRRVGREGDMNAVMKRALGGSLTADNLQDVADLGPIASAGRAAADAAQGRAVSAVSNIGAAIAPYLTGTSEGTRTLIARALMSQDPRAALQKAAQSQEVSSEIRGVIAAMLRAPQRQVASEATR